MRSRSIFQLAGFILLATMLGFAQSLADPWLILASGAKGAISVHTTREELVRLYGASNVVDQDADVGEGEIEPETVLLPKDPERRIEILWKDQDQKTSPAFATIRGVASRWHGMRGISLGTSLKELEYLNGRPFSLSGFGWDYAGTVNSWQKGLIEDDFQRHGRVIVRLNYSTHAGVTNAEVAQVAPDGDFSSHLPEMQKLNPRIYEMMWVFP